VNNQYKLPLATRLPYTADNFYVHRGVKTICLESEESLRIPKFRSFFVSAGARYGKTHFAVWLHALANKLCTDCRLLEGEEFLVGLARGDCLDGMSKGMLFIVDDAHEAFDNVKAGESGAFVNFYEAVRRNAGKIVLLSSKEVSDFSSDEHVISRLASCEGYRIDKPQDEDTAKLIMALARQRGVSLSDRKVKALSLRIGRDIAAIEDYFGVE